MTLIAFNLTIDRFVQESVPEEALKVTRAIAEQALRGVVLKSPVDTGRFRSAWMVSVGAGTDEQPPRLDSAERRELHKSPMPSAGEVIDAGLEVIATAKPFEPIILQNNVDYAEVLEHGSSRQAPRGVLAITVAEIEAQLA